MFAWNCDLKYLYLDRFGRRSTVAMCLSAVSLTLFSLSLSLLYTVLLHLACCASHKPSQICRHFAWLLPLFGNGTICIWKCCMFNSCNILISCCLCRCQSRCDSIRFALLFFPFYLTSSLLTFSTAKFTCSSSSSSILIL